MRHLPIVRYLRFSRQKNQNPVIPASAVSGEAKDEDMDNIFTADFWIHEWERGKSDDTYAVHKGFSTQEYWDGAAATYNRGKGEKQNRKVEKALARFREAGLLFDGMTVLDIGCGPGELALGLAETGARVTALDFSAAMLDRFDQEVPSHLRDRIELRCEDWHEVDFDRYGWKNRFDLVIGFMAPALSTFRSFQKMLDCGKNGFAVRGWADKKPDPIMAALWEKIMDRPQSILYKINLLFAMKVFPEIWFDKMEWDLTTSLDQEIENQTAFFQKVRAVPDTELRQVIESYLAWIQKNGQISRKQQGLTATAVWSQNRW
jgi:SAM-dependent methyltransferase